MPKPFDGIVDPTTWVPGLLEANIHPDHDYLRATHGFGPVGSLFLKLIEWLGPDSSDYAILDRIEAIVRRARMDFAFERDKHGNAYLTVPFPDGTIPNYCFAAHLDTVEHTDVQPKPELYYGGYTNRLVNIGDPDDLWVRSKDGKTIIGADDRSGCAVITALLSSWTPGRYALFTGEEAGANGSTDAANDLYNQQDKHPLFGCTKLMSLDRYGCTSIITFQGSRTASDEFAVDLSHVLSRHQPWFTDKNAYSADSKGLFTDSRNFASLIPECTNLGVGYLDQHSNNESQNLTHLERLTEALHLAAVAEDLQHVGAYRDPGKYQPYTKYSSSGYGSSYSRPFSSGINAIDTDEMALLAMYLDEGKIADSEFNDLAWMVQDFVAEWPLTFLRMLSKHTALTPLVEDIAAVLETRSPSSRNYVTRNTSDTKDIG